MIFRRNSSIREQPYIVEPFQDMKTNDALPIASPATLDTPSTPALGPPSGSAGENNKLNVPSNGRRPSRISNRLVFDKSGQKRIGCFKYYWIRQ